MMVNPDVVMSTLPTKQRIHPEKRKKTTTY